MVFILMKVKLLLQLRQNNFGFVSKKYYVFFLYMTGRQRNSVTAHNRHWNRSVFFILVIMILALFLCACSLRIFCLKMLLSLAITRSFALFVQV